MKPEREGDHSSRFFANGFDRLPSLANKPSRILIFDDDLLAMGVTIVSLILPWKLLHDHVESVCEAVDGSSHRHKAFGKSWKRFDIGGDIDFNITKGLQ